MSLSETSESSETLLGAEDVASLVGKSTRTLESWRMEGCGPRFERVGGRIIYRQSEVARFLAERSGRPAERRRR